MKKYILIIFVLLLNISRSFYIQASIQQETLEPIQEQEQLAPRSLTEILPQELWQIVMNHLPGNNKFLNEVLARQVEVTSETFHSIITAFQQYLLQQPWDLNSQRVATINNALLFFKTSKLTPERNMLYHSFDDIRKIFNFVKEKKQESVLHYAIIYDLVYNKALLNNWYRDNKNSLKLISLLGQRKAIVSLFIKKFALTADEHKYYINKNGLLVKSNEQVENFLMCYYITNFFTMLAMMKVYETFQNSENYSILADIAKQISLICDVLILGMMTANKFIYGNYVPLNKEALKNMLEIANKYIDQTGQNIEQIAATNKIRLIRNQNTPDNSGCVIL